jgi:hypothetical protein
VGGPLLGFNKQIVTKDTRSSAILRGSDLYTANKEIITKEHFGSQFKESLVEAGSNTSTISLRVVGGDEKGSLESETVKYGREFVWNSDPTMTALVRAISNCKRQTRLLVRESVPH